MTDNTETECPTCGKDNFDHARAMKMHHYQGHGESIAKEVVECNVCSSEFEILKYKLENGRGKYCSRECKDKAEREQIDVECDWCGNEMKRQPNRVNDLVFCGNKCRAEYQKDNSRVIKSCKNCGDDFEVVETMLKYDPRDYCSNGCYSDAHSRIVECSNCGDSFNKHLSRVRSPGDNFCSVSCLHEKYRGSDHPSWSGGEQYYGPNWSETRDKILERDSHQCQECGATEELHIHHIIPLRSFDGYEEANSEDNLITLCVGCHAAVEWGDLEVDNNG
jgi:predicted nucleic acid-binding Zn ribbon protein